MVSRKSLFLLEKNSIRHYTLRKFLNTFNFLTGKETMKKATVLALAAFSLVGYQAFAQEEVEVEEPTTVEVETEATETETSVSFNGFKVLFNETEEDEQSLAMTDEPEDEASLALNEEPEGETSLAMNEGEEDEASLA